MRPTKYRSTQAQPLTSSNPEVNDEEKNLLHESVIVDEKQVVELEESLYNKKKSIENLAENIEEDTNNTRRLSRMIKMKNINMIPSIIMRDSKEAKEASIKKLTDDLKRSIKERDIIKKFNDMQKIFIKVILLDDKFAHILKVIKDVYEERIKSITNVFPQYNKRIHELNLEVSRLKKFCEEYNIAYKVKANHTRAMNQTLNLSSMMGNELARKKVVVPKLDLTRVVGNFADDKVVFIPAKKKAKLHNFINDDEETMYKEYIESNKKHNKVFNYSTCSHGITSFL